MNGGDDLCLTILAQFERLGLSDALASTVADDLSSQTTDESEEDSDARNTFLKDYINHEIKQIDVPMATPEQRERQKNEIMQK